MSRHPDISNEEKSALQKGTIARNLSEIRRIAREHRDTVHHLKHRLDKMENEYTKILATVSELGSRLRKDWKD